MLNRLEEGEWHLMVHAPLSRSTPQRPQCMCVNNNLLYCVSFKKKSLQKQKMTTRHITELWVSHLVKEPAKLHCIWCACSKVSWVGAVLGKQNSTLVTNLKVFLVWNRTTLCVDCVIIAHFKLFWSHLFLFVEQINKSWLNKIGVYCGLSLCLL